MTLFCLEPSTVTPIMEPGITCITAISTRNTDFLYISFGTVLTRISEDLKDMKEDQKGILQVVLSFQALSFDKEICNNKLLYCMFLLPDLKALCWQNLIH